MNQPRTVNPVSLAVVASLAILAAIIITGAAIGGSYLLTWHAIHAEQAFQAAIRFRELGASVREAVPTCKALIAMDHASDTPPHLAAAIHQVVTDTKCYRMLSMIQHHVPYPTIAKRLGAH